MSKKVLFGLFLFLALLSNVMAAPLLVMEFPENITYNLNLSIPINFTVDSANHTWYILDTGEPQFITENTTFDIPSPGTYNFTLYANDTDNNRSSSSVIFNYYNEPPAIENLTLDEPILIVDENLNITLYIDDEDPDKAWINVTFPDSSSVIEQMTLSSPSYLEFTDTSQTGKYNLTIFANDTSNNEVNQTSFFYVYQAKKLEMNITDKSNMTFTIFYDGTETHRNQSTCYNFSEIVPATFWDLRLNNSDFTFDFFDVNVSDNVKSTFDIDEMAQCPDLGLDDSTTFIRGFSVDLSGLDFNFSEMAFGFSGSYADDSKLLIYKCSNWDENCLSSWVSIKENSTFNTTSNTVQISGSTYSAFVLVQNLTQDPTTTTTTPPSTTSPTTTTPDGGGGTGGSGSSGNSKFLKITSYPTELSIPAGSSKNETVKVKAIDFDQKTKLTVSGIPRAWFSITPSGSPKINPGEEKEFKVEFNVPSSANVKEYSGTFKAESDIEDVSESFDLTVTEPEPEEEEILDANTTVYDENNTYNENFTAIEDQITKLESDINSIKEKGGNVTKAEEGLAIINSKFNEAKQNWDSGDYASANQILEEIEEMIYETKSLITGSFITAVLDKLGSFGGMGYVGILGGLGAATGAGGYFYLKSTRKKFIPSADKKYDYKRRKPIFKNPFKKKSTLTKILEDSDLETVENKTSPKKVKSSFPLFKNPFRKASKKSPVIEKKSKSRKVSLFQNPILKKIKPDNYFKKFSSSSQGNSKEKVEYEYLRKKWEEMKKKEKKNGL